MKWILRLEDCADADGARIGGKGVALAALHRAGLPIPRTACLTTGAYEAFVLQAGLRPVIQQEIGRKRVADMRWEELWDASLRIRNRFLRAPIPPGIASEIGDPLSDVFGDHPLVVRSSAPGEDAAGASFAGLHDSFVGVRGPAALVEAVREVWASLWTDRALLYRRALGLEASTSAMAVVIQEMVEGTISGVAFGIHPSNRECMAVEAVYGLNQGLVDGTIEPDRWSIERDGGRIAEHTEPSRRRRLVARGSELVVEAVPQDASMRPPLDASRLAQVVTAVRDAEALFGAPQDVEWTVSDDRLVYLQSRPVTTAPAGEGDSRAWYLSLTRSLDNLRDLREKVEHDLLPAMDREATEIAERDLETLDAEALAGEIAHRRAAHDRWVDVYWREFIPLAHGIRLFGRFYNEIMRPEDPYEFMTLLAGTPLLSVRRNRALGRLAGAVREDAALHARLAEGKQGAPDFERALEEFERAFGDAAFSDQVCFQDRDRLVRLLLAMADAPHLAEASTSADAEALSTAFLSAVSEDRRALAAEILDLGRASYRLRDDDNLHLSRLETLALAAVEEGRRRLRAGPGDGGVGTHTDEVLGALRKPNLVVEPRLASRPTTVEAGFRAVPRQLVGQPAGPGVATGPARRVRDVDDLFRVQSGDVLVCDAVDPNMTFVIPLVAAVVERRGGMLVHGAIIAREYGLPCITGVPDVMGLIETGDRLTVDGYLGILTVSRA